MKIPKFPYLLIHDGKHGSRHILANDEEEYKQAWLAMFHAIRQWDGYYDDHETWDVDQQEFYKMAMCGDWRGALWLLNCRSDYEYEGIRGLELSDVSDILDQLNVRQCDMCKLYFHSEALRTVPGCYPSQTLPFDICKGCDPLEKK